MFWKKRAAAQKADYDHDNQEPVLKCSICTGEQVAGFRNVHTGGFEDVMLIRGESDLRKFMDMYGLAEAPQKIY